MRAAEFVDCDVHLTVPDTRTLVPYLDDYWREHVLRRGIDGNNLEISAYPPNAPINCRPDWKPASGPAGSQFAHLRDHVLEPFNPRFAICNVLHGAQIMYSEDLSAALCKAVNNWIAAELLDRDPRLRASIVVPVHSPDLAAEEIERRAADKRFVQVLMLSMTEMPLGRRQNWPIYRAGRAPRPAHRHSRRQQLPPSAERARLAVLLPGGLRLTGAWLCRHAEQPGHRGRVRQISPPQGRADRIRRDLAARLSVADQQDLARRARRNTLARSARPPTSSATTCASPSSRSTTRTGKARCRPFIEEIGSRRHAAVLDRLPALALRGHRRHARRLARRRLSGRSWSTIRWRPIRVCHDLTRAKRRRCNERDSPRSQARDRATRAFTGFIDCDVHPFYKSPAEFDEFLPEAGATHRRTIGGRTRQGLGKASNYPRMSPGNGQRMDAWPPDGSYPGSDLPFMQKQLLDLFDVAYGLLAPLVGGAGGERNIEFGAAMATAVNEWQLARWCDPDPRLKASVQVNVEHQSGRHRGDREARRRSPLRAGADPAARAGAARPPPLLADPGSLRRERLPGFAASRRHRAAIPPPAAAGRRSITRNIRPTCRPCRRW